MDHLEEERSGGITIDTTQTFFETAQRRYVIIDAPGHAEFIKNMITGATQADAAVLIVDASEGVRDQTRRHAYMLSLLGLNQIIVVINKMDRVDFAQSRFAEVQQCMADLLDSISLDPILYVPICAIRGDNVAMRSASMGWYDGPTFIEGLDSLTARQPPIDKPLLVSIQDVYQIGEKQVGVGRVESGVLSKGLQIRILPRGHTTTVATIDKFLEDPQSAVAGECIGLTTVDSAILNRGDVICLSSEEPILTDRISASVFWMAGHDLTKDLRLTIRCTTQETGCTIEHINRRIDSSRLELIEEDAQVLKELEVGEVIIKTDRPILTKDFADVPPFGRFVLVEGDTTCAGGIVTPHREPEG
jgi:sulfate adenylyltransferase subunit 1 (EFTu-like GTPase family)